MEPIPTPDRNSNISLIGELNVLLKHSRLVLGLAVVGATVAVSILTLVGPTFVAESRFMPQVKQVDASQLAGLAAQFGVNLGAGQDPTQSVEFYGELLESPDLLEQLALSRFRFATDETPSDSLSGTLVELLEAKGETHEQRVRDAVETLQEAVQASTGLRQAGIVSLTTAARWPELSEQINRRVLDLVNEFNLERRQSEAGAERKFVGERLEEMRGELEAREAELAQFLERNRLYEQSPTLRFEAERLGSRVDLAQQVVTSLAQSYEESRIQEVRNTPAITLIDTPENSAIREDSLVLQAAIGGFLGGVAGIVLAFVAEFVKSDRRRNPAAYAEFKEFWRKGG